MNSRYNFMKEGTVRDSVSGSLYPDPLSLNYLEFNMVTAPPVVDRMDDAKIMYFWLEVSKYYGNSEWDDVVLTLNGVPHRNLLSHGDMIGFPDIMDIKNSLTRGGSV